MPIYEYKCGACGETFESIVRMGMPDKEVPCSACGKHEAQRCLSAFAVGGPSGAKGSAGPAQGGGCGQGGFT